MLGAFVAFGALALTVVGCGSINVGPSQEVALTKAPYTKAPPTPTFSPRATIGPGGPGKPYTADDIEPILAAAPVGVSSRLRTPEVAAAIADRIWTFDGRPYQELAVGGSCEGQLCDIVGEGVPAFAANRDIVDVWFLRLDLQTRLFSDNGEPGLRGFPPEMVAGLDALARSLDADGTFKALPLIRAEWSLPPPGGAFVLRYGTGTQEGDVNWFVTISTIDKAIVSIRKQVM